MPVLPDGTYPVMEERIGTPEQLMVRPNPPASSDRGRFQRVYLRPARIPKWLRDGLAKQGLRGAVGVANAGMMWKALKREIARWGAEKFIVIPMNTKNRPIAFVEVSHGILDASLTHPREVFQPAVATGAASIMMIHNHPSGDPEPSAEDIAVTRRMADVGRDMGIPVLDHLVVSKSGFVSLAERGVV